MCGEAEQSLEVCVYELAKTFTLDDDWDGMGTEAPSPLAIKESIRILTGLDALGFLPSRVVPSVEGGIGLAFLRGHERRQADIEIFNDGEMFAGTYSDKEGVKVWPVQVDGLGETVQKMREFFREA